MGIVEETLGGTVTTLLTFTQGIAPGPSLFFGVATGPSSSDIAVLTGNE